MCRSRPALRIRASLTSLHAPDGCGEALDHLSEVLVGSGEGRREGLWSPA
jgi:hypothetical protein